MQSQGFPPGLGGAAPDQPRVQTLGSVGYLLPTDSINAIVAQQLADIEMN